MHAMRPFPWAGATATEISRLPGLGDLPVDLIDLVLPRLKRFVEEHEGSSPSNACAVGQVQDMPAETHELLRGVARPAEPFAQMEQAPQPAYREHHDENAEPEPIFEDPPSSSLQGLLELDHIWEEDVSQLQGSLTLPTGEVVERSSRPGPQDFHSSSGVGGYGAALSGIGTETLCKVDFGTLCDGWEGFEEF
jgi:hypothetical protein